MVSALSVLCFVVDRGTDDLHFAGREVSLVVGHIVQRVPETEFHIGINLEGLCAVRGVSDGQAVDLTGIVKRNKIEKLRGQSVFGGRKPGVADTVTAFVGVQRSLCRLPAGIPHTVAVGDIVVFSV